MNKTIRLGAAAIALFGAMGMSTAAHAQSATADARAEVLDSLTLTNDSDLDFGTMVVNGAGSATLNLSGRTCSGAIICSGTENLAGFTVTGTGGNDVTINLPTASVNLVHTANAGSTAANHVIVLSNFSSTEAGDEVTLDALTSDATFGVGGQIDLDGSEIPGEYVGTFNVSVEYS